MVMQYDMNMPRLFMDWKVAFVYYFLQAKKGQQDDAVSVGNDRMR